MRMENTSVWRYISFWNMVIFHCPAGFQYRKRSPPELKGSTCYQPHMSWRYAMWHRLLETQIAHQTFKRQTTACAWFGDCKCSENSHTCQELFVFPNVQGSSSWLRTGRKGRFSSIPFRKEQLQICGSFISSLGPKPAFNRHEGNAYQSQWPSYHETIFTPNTINLIFFVA